MPQAAYAAIINVVGVGRGASGTTELKGATRASIPPIAFSTRKQKAGGDLMPRKVVTMSVESVRVAVETESFAEYLQAMTDADANTIQTININFNDTSGTAGAAAAQKTVCKFAKVVGVGQSTFPPTETQGPAPRWEIQYELEQGTNVTKLSEAITTSSGHATLS